MRRMLAAAAAAALLGCGGGGKDQAPVDGGPPLALPTGTGTAAFTMNDAGAVIIAPVACNIQGNTVYASGLMLGFSSFGGLCGFVRTTGLCGDKASATLAGLAVFKAGALQAQSPVGPGTYTYVANPTPDASGNVVQVSGDVTQTDMACGGTQNGVTAGSVTVTSAMGGRIVGSLNLTFSDGSTLTGPFDVGTCAYTVDICSIIAGTDCPGARSCIP